MTQKKNLAWVVFIASVLGGGVCWYLDWRSGREVPFSEDGRRMLDAASVGTLYSLEPAPYLEKETEANRPRRDKLGEFEILGVAEIRGAELELVRSEFLAAARARSERVQNKCDFEPRHGLRIQESGHVYDYLICFQCGDSAWMIDGQRAWFGAARGEPDKLNALFDRLGLQRSKTSHEELSKAAENAGSK